MTALPPSVLVVGGGLAGLATAAFLVRSGARVTVLEATDRLGGRAATDVVSGMAFNLGPHALYRGGPAARVLAELGVEVRGGIPAPKGGLIRDGVVHALPAGPGALLSTGALRFGQRVALATAYARMLATNPATLRGSTADWLATLTADADVRAVLEASVRVATYANCPDALPASVALSQVKAAVLDGVTYVDGGWQTLVDPLVEQVRRGGEVRTGVRVASVQPGGVTLADGEELAGDHVVVAAPLAAARQLLGDRAPASLDAQGPAVRAACLDVALREAPNPALALALGFDEPLYVSNHSKVSQLGDGVVLHAALYLAPDHRRRPAEDRAVIEGALDLVQPGWRDLVIEQRWLPRMVVVPALPPLDGLGGRPSIRVEEGLWLAGDWVGDEGYLADGALASASAVARAILAAVGRRAA